MNQIHEAVRWLYQDKGEPPREIARKMKLDTSQVHAILHRFGLTTRANHKAESNFGPKVWPAPIDRDPCTWCGTRADFGCKHNRSAA